MAKFVSINSEYSKPLLLDELPEINPDTLRQLMFGIKSKQMFPRRKK